MKKICYFMAIIPLVIFFDWALAEAKDEAVMGIPMIQARLSMDTSLNINLDNSQKVKNRLIITKKDDKYYWETRDQRELLYQKMGKFDLFIDLKTGGYIKVVQQADGRYVYLEHITVKNLKGFTYWGIVNLYQP